MIMEIDYSNSGDWNILIFNFPKGKAIGKYYDNIKNTGGIISTS